MSRQRACCWTNWEDSPSLPLLLLYLPSNTLMRPTYATRYTRRTSATHNTTHQQRPLTIKTYSTHMNRLFTYVRVLGESALAGECEFYCEMYIWHGYTCCSSGRERPWQCQTTNHALLCHSTCTVSYNSILLTVYCYSGYLAFQIESGVYIKVPNIWLFK